MKILIDIGHPAHVHYFKNFIKIMKSKGHEFLITARDKEVSQQLLREYKIEFVSRGKGGKGFLGKLTYLFKANLIVLQQALSFKPELFLSFASPYAAQVAWVLQKPHIAFTDTEHAYLGNMAFIPFSEVVCTPSCYKNNIGKKHIRFDGYMELLYLSANYFKPDNNIHELLGLKKSEQFAILRFVSWEANHDIGHTGISSDNKVNVFKSFSKYAKVLISSEGPLPEELEKHRINIPPEKMHDVLASAVLLYGESATMASECAVLGVPAIYLDNEGRGYTDEQEAKYHLVYNFSESEVDQEKSIKKGVEILKNTKNRSYYIRQKDKLITDKIDVTKFMVSLVESHIGRE